MGIYYPSVPCLIVSWQSSQKLLLGYYIGCDEKKVCAYVQNLLMLQNLLGTQRSTVSKNRLWNSMWANWALQYSVRDTCVGKESFLIIQILQFTPSHDKVFFTHWTWGKQSCLRIKCGTASARIYEEWCCFQLIQACGGGGGEGGTIPNHLG